MRKLAIIAFLLLVAVTFNTKADNTTKGSYTEVVNGVEFEMVFVEGGNLKSNGYEYQLENYHISSTEVTQELWEAVMGTTVAMQRDKINPSMPLAGVGDKYPIYYVSQKEAKEFCKRLSQLTGKNYSLPIACQWQYAAIGGKQSRDYKYSGSNNVEDVAWIKCESTHPVATKMPNELGIYDMSGNVYEWCEGDCQLRGGSWMCDAPCTEWNNVNIRDAGSHDKIVGFRVVENTSYTTRLINGKDFIITINGVSFKMVFVEGGSFKMGAQSTDPNGENYDSEACGNEQPVHNVTLSDYYIGETEVTQVLWEAVMGTTVAQQQKRRTNFPPVERVASYDPMAYITWNDCQVFIKNLNQLTGMTFRLPTEAEWEYAARGGNKSRGYKYSGSNTIDEVAWYDDNAFNGWSGIVKQDWEPRRVGTKNANELGIYDMSGNVYEWCSDWYGSYSSSSQTNPTGPTSGSDRVLRGGNWFRDEMSCRVSDRRSFSPYYNSDYSGTYDEFGFRLALCP